MKRQWLWLVVILCCTAAFFLIPAGEQRLSGQTASAVAAAAVESPSYVFQLQFGGTVAGEYTECSGLGSSNEIMENLIVSGANVVINQKTPGRPQQT